jgi:hypothetical protein
MTSVPRQLAIFAAVLLVLYAVGYGVGHLIDEGAPSHGVTEEQTAPAPGASHNPDNAGH